MSEELRPCPFCKSNNTTLDYYEISGPQELGTIVVCNDCGASAKSIVDWNTRPIEDALNKRIAELEALVDELVNIGDNLFDSLNPIAWKHEWLDKWWKLSSCRRGERE